MEFSFLFASDIAVVAAAALEVVDSFEVLVLVKQGKLLPVEAYKLIPFPIPAEPLD
jgi:hypothetical protein